MTQNITLGDVANYGNLVVAHANARRGKAHYRAVIHFEQNQDSLLHKLQDSIRSGNYHTSDYKSKIICDSGKDRLISKLPYYPDRIVHWAIMLQLEAVFLSQFSKHSHAAIPGKGIHSALYQTREIIINHIKESVYCLKIDIKKYFQNIDHGILKVKIRKLTDDNPLLRHLEENIDSFPIGVPIGNYTSQYWANFYLSDFDKALESRNILFIRYMDDIVFFGASKEYLHKLLSDVREHLEQRLHVSIKSNWQIFPTSVRGVDFVGYRIYPNRVILRKSTFRKMRRKLSKVMKHLKSGIFKEQDRSRIASYAGWIKYCTPRVGNGLFELYIKPLLDLLPTDETKFKTKIYKVIR